MGEQIDAKNTDYSHGSRVTGMMPERPRDAYFQAHEKSRSSEGIKALSRRIGGRILGALRNLEIPGGNERVLMGQITEINLARMLAGSKEGSLPRKEPFTRQAAMGSLGYPGDPLNSPYEYAAMLHAEDALVGEGVLGDFHPEDPQQAVQKIVIDFAKLNEVAGRPSTEDVSLSKVLSAAKDQEHDDIVAKIITEHQETL
jgi:hypothetical protein